MIEKQPFLLSTLLYILIFAIFFKDLKEKHETDEMQSWFSFHVKSDLDSISVASIHPCWHSWPHMLEEKRHSIPYLHIQDRPGIAHFASIAHRKSVIASFQFELFKCKLDDLNKAKILIYHHKNCPWLQICKYPVVL